ncbi:erythromycin esterase family protein [Deinococcus sp. Marseille-Q6407]|uniref:erythromycin esterase family protein n=1 Tax=Deinococcus sp. Marseille-Q6407 TaxID=2969223 RepID=UPI0021C1B183|nr:erythromycin esterase family protein [Deinococcus sp. Marseille-Q6407]
MNSFSLLPALLSDVLTSLPARPQLLALGEPSHGLQVFPQWRNRIFRVLVQQHGFRSIALESDLLAGQRVDAYIRGASNAPLDEVMAAGFSHGFGAYAANRELVSWLREFNTGLSAAEQVRFYGFDAPMENFWAASPRPNLLALHAFLSRELGTVEPDAAHIQALCGDDARWTDEAAALNPARSAGDTPEARQLRLLADDLHTLLRREAPRLQPLPDFWQAQMHARTALGLLRYHANMARSAPDRLSRMLALRDLMMADNLSAIARREQERGTTLVFAHNLHLKRGPSAMQLGDERSEWWGAGALCHQRHGPAYAFIGSGLGRSGLLGVAEPDPNTPEGRLWACPDPVQLLPTRELASLLTPPLQDRRDFPPQAFALRAAELPQLDGLLFVRDADH